MKAYDDLIML